MFVQLATTLGTDFLLTADSAQLFFPSLKYIAKEQDKTTKPNLEHSKESANLGNYISYSFRWNQGNGVNNKYTMF